LSFHCGSAQFLRTISADSVALAGATGGESEQATRNIASKTRTPNFIDVFLCIEGWTGITDARYSANAGLGGRALSR
jgi:hypothetical protein